MDLVEEKLWIGNCIFSSRNHLVRVGPTFLIPLKILLPDRSLRRFVFSSG